MFTCGITPRIDFIFHLDRCVKAWPVLPQLYHFDQSLLVCLVGLQASIPRSLPGHWVRTHSTLSVWKTPLGTFPWTGYDMVMTRQFGSCYLCRRTANIRENRRDDSCEVGTYLNQCLQLSVQLCPREKPRCFWSSNLECVLMNCWQISCLPSSSELLGYPALHSRFSTSVNKSATSR